MRKRVFLFSLCCCCCCCKGFLDSSSHDTNLRVGSKLDLPFWLVKAIYNDKFKFAHIDLPKWYKNFYHEILKADPIVVDLRKMGPYYYEFGILLVRLLDPDQSQSIAKMLIWVWAFVKADHFCLCLCVYVCLPLLCVCVFQFQCFRHRFRRIMDLAGQTDHRDLYKAITKLDATETEIYKAGQQDHMGFLKWQRREFCKLTPSIIVIANKNKRKRNVSDTDTNGIAVAAKWRMWTIYTCSLFYTPTKTNTHTHTLCLLIFLFLYLTLLSKSTAMSWFSSHRTQSSSNFFVRSCSYFDFTFTFTFTFTPSSIFSKTRFCSLLNTLVRAFYWSISQETSHSTASNTTES